MDMRVIARVRPEGERFSRPCPGRILDVNRDRGTALVEFDESELGMRWVTVRAMLGANR